MDTHIDLSRALADVRKAYRLIWLYQHRVVNIINVITEKLGYKFYRWDTGDIGRMPGQVTKNPFGDGEWIWSTLPLYRMSLLYLPTTIAWNVQKKDEWMLEVYVESDSGLKWCDDDTEVSPTEFLPVDESQTYLRLYAWYCSQDGELDWFHSVWT